MNFVTQFIQYESCDTIIIVVGPEGGFAQSEVEKCLEAGFKSITLGKRILRTETAGMVTAAILIYELG